MTRIGQQKDSSARSGAAGAAPAQRRTAEPVAPLLELQAAAGNAAVSRLVPRARPAEPPEPPPAAASRHGNGVSIQRNPDPPPTGTQAPPQQTDHGNDWRAVRPVGDDPRAHVARTVDLFRSLDTVRPDPDFTGDPQIFRPVAALVHFEDYVVGTDRSGQPVTVLPQGNRPVMTEIPVVLLHESATTRVWLLQINGNGVLRVRPYRQDQFGARPVEGARAGSSRLLIYVSGLALGEDVADSMRRRAGGRRGTAAEAPEWAHRSLTRLRRRRAAAGGAGAPEGTEGGRGLGREDRGGTGGGGTEEAPDAVPGGDGRPRRHDQREGAGTTPPQQRPPRQARQPQPSAPPGQTGQRPPATAGSAPRPPLQGPPRFDLQTRPDGAPQVRITMDRASTTVDLRDGESDEALDGRIDAAIEQLQQSRDPHLSERVAGRQTPTGFRPPPRGQGGEVGDPALAKRQAAGSAAADSPGQRAPGARGGANAPPYPSRITMDGQQVTAPVTTLGATNAFTMVIDYAALSYGMTDEVFNRMQPISFYWELIDVTGVAAEQQEARARQTNVGQGTRVGVGSGDARNIGRTLEDIAEDQQADLQMMREQDWPWEARAAYLGVIGISNVVRTLGSIISSYVEIVTRPLNERSVGFDDQGEYILRCVATPQVSEEARADPANHVIRASSVAVLPIKVVAVNTRAVDALNEEDRARAELEAAVANARTEEERRAAEARLELYRRSARASGVQRYRSTLEAMRAQLATARALERRVANGEPETSWTAEELYLQVALVTSRTTVHDRVRELERQLRAIGGEGAERAGGTGEHERWVGDQASRFRHGREFRPRVVLASEVNGQVTPVQCMLGEAEDSTDAAPRWRLVDITSPGSRDRYDGRSAESGVAGHQAAIRDAFRAFAENNQYGRGTIAIRLPPELLQVYGAITVEERMRSRPGAGARALQRLQDLATAAEIAGIFLTGGTAGAAIGAVGGLAGAVVAVHSLARRARTGHVLEVDALFDVLGVVGGLASIAGVGAAVARSHVDALASSGQALPSWVSRLEGTERALHIHGRFGLGQQVLVIPYQLVKELGEISGSGGAEGQQAARRALALLRAVRSGAVTVLQTTGTLDVTQGGGRRTGGDGDARQPGLPEGFRSGDADAHADGRAPALPPVTTPPASGPDSTRPPGGGGGADQRPPTNGGADQRPPARTPSLAELVAMARQAAAVRRQQAEAVVAQAGGEGAGGGGTRAPGGDGAPPPTPPRTESQPPGSDERTPTPPGQTNTPAGTPHGAPPNANPGDAAAPRREAIAAITARNGANPSAESQQVRADATTTAASADADALALLRSTGDFGTVRRDVDTARSLSPPQLAALKSRLQEARLAVTNEHIRAVLERMRQQFPDLEFHVQDLGTVGFNSDRDITIRVTAKDEAAYARLSQEERAAMDRRMVAASATAVPDLYAALERVGFPAERSLDTNFYTELHEGRIRPAGRAEATMIAADQQVVSMSEIIVNAGREAWHDYVARQRAEIDAMGARGMPEADVRGLRARLDEQVSAAESNVRRLLGDLPSGGHGGGEGRGAALAAARRRLVEALERQPPASPRELRQLMADIKLLEPDAYGTRGAVEAVVLGGQAMSAATLEAVRADGFRSQREIERGSGTPGPHRFNEATGRMEEVSAEQELSRRRAEAHGHVGHRRPGDDQASSYEVNVRRLQVAEAVLGHLLGHLPEPSSAAPSDMSAAAKNLGRIVSVAEDIGVRSRDRGLHHLPDIVAAKKTPDSVRATAQALSAWAAEATVRAWAEGRGLPLVTEAEVRAAFVSWAREQALALVGQVRTRTETGALYGDVPVGTGSTPARSFHEGPDEPPTTVREGPAEVQEGPPPAERPTVPAPPRRPPERPAAPAPPPHVVGEAGDRAPSTERVPRRAADLASEPEVGHTRSGMRVDAPVPYIDRPAAAARFLRDKWGARPDRADIDFDFTGVDQPMAAALATTIDGLFQRYPGMVRFVNRIEIGTTPPGRHGGSVHGVTTQEIGVIRLSTSSHRTLAGAARRAQADTKVSTRAVLHTLVHEFGHMAGAVAETTASPPRGASTTERLLQMGSVELNQAAMAAKVEELVTRLSGLDPASALHRKEWIEENLSQYASEGYDLRRGDPREVIAEAFAEYHLMGDHARPFARAIGEWLVEEMARVPR